MLLLSALYAIAFSWPLLQHLNVAYAIEDWYRFRALDIAAVNTVRNFHQLPMWTAYLFGGMPLIGNPESRVLTPWFLLHLIYGSAMGFNLEVPGHLAILWAGGYVLGRVLGFGRLASVGCASVFPSSSWLYLHFGAGHPHFLPYAYTPWMVAFFWLGVERHQLKWAVAIASLMALALFEAGVYPITDTGLLLTMLSIGSAVQRRSLWPFAVLGTAAICSAAFAAPKMLPFFATGWTRPTGVADEWLNLSEYPRLVFSRDQNCHLSVVWAGRGWMPICDLGAYMSPMFVCLAIFGGFLAFSQARLWLSIMGVFTLLAMGNYFGAYSPWTLLHHLPPFSWQWAVPRYFIMVDFCLSILVGLGIHAFPDKRAVMALLLVGVIEGCSLWPSNLIDMNNVILEQSEAGVFRQVHDENAGTLRLVMAGKGAVNGGQWCGQSRPAGVHVNPGNQAGYRGEQYLIGPGTLQPTFWSPEGLAYEVDARAPTLLVVNQNYDSDWRATEGEVISHDGLLAVDLPAGHRVVRLWYSCWRLMVGCLIGLAALVLAPWMCHANHWYSRDGYPRDAGLAGDVSCGDGGGVNRVSDSGGIGGG